MIKAYIINASPLPVILTGNGSRILAKNRIRKAGRVYQQSRVSVQTLRFFYTRENPLISIKQLRRSGSALEPDVINDGKRQPNLSLAMPVIAEGASPLRTAGLQSSR